MKERITLSQIAREAGCAISTVSLALRGSHAVESSTREKILKVSRRLGYRPHPLLAALASRRFRSSRSIMDVPLAFISASPWELKEKVMLAEASQQAPQFGYKIAVYPLEVLAASHEPGRILYNCGIQGIILPHFFDPSSLPCMDWTPFSVVALGHSSFGGDSTGIATGFHRVTYDHHETVTVAWKRALAAGYGRIGAVFCQHRQPIRDDELRYAALLYCQAKTPKYRRVPIFDQGTIFGQPCELRHWLERHRPEIVLGMTAVNCRDIHNAGWRIPDDVAFLALHKEEPDLTVEQHTMAGMIQERAEIRVALELLDLEVRLLHRGISNLPRTVLLHPRWVDGESMPSPNSQRG